MISPADIQGHWVRQWIKAPGFEDHTTRVHWKQVGLNYADLRIPRARPDLTGAAALSDLPAAALLDLAQAEGFAGQVTLSGDHCTWHREINWHGPSEAQDVGAIRFDDDGQMIETGVHADYAELWQPNPGAGAFLRFSAQGYRGFCARVGERSVLGIGRPDKEATKSLLKALADGRRPDGIDALFDGVHALGQWQGDAMTAQLATNPFTEQGTILTVKGQTAVWLRTNFDGTQSLVEMAITP